MALGHRTGLELDVPLNSVVTLEARMHAAGQSRSAAALETGLLQGLLSDLEAAGINYVVAGNTSGLPAVTGDVDIVVSQEDFDVLTGAVDIWFAEGRTVVQAMRHETRAIAFVIASAPWPGIESLELVQVDICADYVRYARRLLPAAWLLEGRRCYTAPDGTLRMWVPAPEPAFTYYLVKKIAKRSVDETAFRYLAQTLADADELDKIESLLGERLASAAIDCIRAGNLDGFNKLLPELANQLKARNPRRPTELIPEYGRMLSRLRNPTGLAVEVHGSAETFAADVAERLSTALRRAFRRTTVVRARSAKAAGTIKVYALLCSSTLVVELHSGGTAGATASRDVPNATRLAVKVGQEEPIENAVDRTARIVINHLAQRQRQRMLRG